jgi:small subunit ribosomal protein S11
MSVLARIRTSPLCNARPRLCSHPAVAHFSSSATRAAARVTGHEAQPKPASDFTSSLFDAVGSAPPRPTGLFSPRATDDLPPAAPRDGYAKPNPAQANPFRQEAAQQERRGFQNATVPVVPVYRMYVKATRNNILITLTRPNGDPLRTYTGGGCGFKHVNRSTHEAAHQCAVKTFKLVEGILPQEPNLKLHVFMNGFGKGRDAVRQAFLGTEGDLLRPLVSKITDKTPIKIGGNRAKKARRI